MTESSRFASTRVLLPQPEIDYCYLAGGAYMFSAARRNFLGALGTAMMSLEPDAEANKRATRVAHGNNKGREGCFAKRILMGLPERPSLPHIRRKARINIQQHRILILFFGRLL